MEVRCERCRARQEVDESRVPDGGVKVACRCGHRFLLTRRVLAVAVPLRSNDPEPGLPLADLASAGGEGGLDPALRDPAWAREGGAPPPEVEGEGPRALAPTRPSRRPRRALWVAVASLGLIVVAASVPLLRRRAEVDGQPPARPPAVPAPVASSVPSPAPVPTAAPAPVVAVPAAPPPVPVPSPAPADPPVPRPASATPALPPSPGPLATELARARTLRDRGHCEEALEAYGRALARDGRNAVALAGRGACYLELTRYAQAEASFEAALESDPRSAEALFGLAETYRYMGRKAEAVAGYERYLAVRPTGDDAATARRLMSQLKE